MNGRAWDREAVTNLPTKTYACSNDEHAKTLTACICMVYQTWAPPLPSVWDTSGVICRGQESICSGSGAILQISQLPIAVQG